MVQIRMTDQQLIYFSTIVELGSFSEAAMELNISQSSISKQIMQLEDELGIQLFDRSSRKARLSSAGEYLYQDILSALVQINHIRETAAMLSASGQKRLSLLALPVIGHFNFYIPIQLFENAHSEFHVELEELEEPDMYRRINLGDYDAAITYYNPNQPVKNARFYPLVEDELILVCHKDHELSSQPFITPSMLNDMPVLSMQKYTCISQLYDLYFRKHNSYPHVMFRGRPNTILVGAEAGQGPALLTRIHTDILRVNNVSLIPFSPSLKGILGIIVNEQSHQEPLLRELVSFLLDYKK